MRDICFIDKTYDSTLSNLYHLSIQISLDGFSFCILDVPKGKYIVLKSFHLFLRRPRLLLKHVRDLIAAEELLQFPFKSVDILYSTSQVTLVPQAFYQKGSVDRFLGFTHTLEKGFSVERTQLPLAQAWAVFAMPENLKEYLLSKYPKATIRHNIFPLVEKGLKDLRSESTTQVLHLNFFRHSFEAVLLEGHQLLLCNMFDYSNERDVIFHMLNIFEQLKLKPETAELVVHGEVAQVAPLYHLFRKYVKRTAFAKPGNLFTYSYTFSQVPEHYFTSLLNVYKCE